MHPSVPRDVPQGRGKRPAYPSLSLHTLRLLPTGSLREVSIVPLSLSLSQEVYRLCSSAVS